MVTSPRHSQYDQHIQIFVLTIIDGWEAWPDHTDEHDHDHEHGHGHAHGHSSTAKTEPIQPVKDISTEGSPKKRAKVAKTESIGQKEKTDEKHHHPGRRERKRVARAHQ